MKDAQKKKLNTAMQLIFVAGVAAALLCGILRAVISPKDINYYENRRADTIEELTAQGYMDGEFQQSVEKALADQIPLAQRMKILFNDVNSAFRLTFLRPLIGQVENRYIHYNGMCFFNGHFAYPTLDLESYSEAMAESTAGLNRAVSANPDCEFYVYLVEYEALLDMETGEKQPLYEYLCDTLELPEERIGRLELRDYSDFNRWFYNIDHHWNAAGSYQGYLDVLKLLHCADKPLEPVGKRSFTMLTGSKVKECGLSGFSEETEVYDFEYGNLGIAYGAEDAFFSGVGGEFSYSNFYGGDGGELIFDTGRDERENVLIIGDSYDNAVLNLLASHYNRLYSVDLRNYEHDTGEVFDIDAYIAEHEIDKVLFLGSFLLFAGDFTLEG